MPPAIIREGLALHILHHEPRGPIAQRARVIQPGNKDVPELRQRLDLAGKAFPPGSRHPRMQQKLDRHRTAGIFAFEEAHHAHPALAQYSDEPVGADLLESERFYRRAHDSIRDFGQAPVQQRRAPAAPLQQVPHLGHQFRIIPARRVQEGPPFGFRPRRRVVENGCDSIPARAVHRRYSASGQILPASQALAARQSRSTADSETPSNAAVSATSIPPKNRLSTTCAWRGLKLASSSRDMSSASNSSGQEAASSRQSPSGTKLTSPAPPLLRAPLRRASSTRIWRIAFVAIPLKWVAEVSARCGESLSFSQASCTSAVELIVALASIGFVHQCGGTDRGVGLVLSHKRRQPAQLLINQAEEIVHGAPLFRIRAGFGCGRFFGPRHDGFPSRFPHYSMKAKDETGSPVRRGQLRAYACLEILAVEQARCNYGTKPEKRYRKGSHNERNLRTDEFTAPHRTVRHVHHDFRRLDDCRSRANAALRAIPEFHAHGFRKHDQRHLSPRGSQHRDHLRKRHYPIRRGLARQLDNRARLPAGC